MFLMVILTFSVTFSFIPSVFAYETFIGHRVSAPYNKYYWESPEGNISGFSVRAETDAAMNRWNNTENTKVWMYKTSNQAASVIDFWYHQTYDPYLAGQTVCYYYDTYVPNPDESDWTWNQVHLSTSINYNIPDPNGQIYVNRQFTTIAAHEVGHAFGLAHVGDTTTLMFPDLTNYRYWGLCGPTADEIEGVRAIYGPLY